MGLAWGLIHNRFFYIWDPPIVHVHPRNERSVSYRLAVRMTSEAPNGLFQEKNLETNQSHGALSRPNDHVCCKNLDIQGFSKRSLHCKL